ncbi:MAG: dienelactone hydrolase family protein [Pyrinomonadaceae bacterium]
MHTENISFSTAGGDTTAFVTRPDQGATRAVIVIQEYWGLNDHIRSIAGRYADEGFCAISPDLYRGAVAKTSDEAAKLMNALKTDDGLDIINNVIQTSSERYSLTHFGITGFCMGGSYALRAACELEGLSAAAAFYGDIPEESVLAKLKTPTIFISATQDKWINAEKVGTLETAVERYELPLTSVKYEADHAFFNDTRPEVYDPVAAADAWALVIGFMSDNL